MGSAVWIYSESLPWKLHMELLVLTLHLQKVVLDILHQAFASLCSSVLSPDNVPVV